jgi:ParB-like chromosome segregation protein Spo0J
VLDVQRIPAKAITPNPWNPNKQSDRQFEAEIESIQTYGFILPIIVRPADKKGKFEIVDGEHRMKALDVITHNSKNGGAVLRDDLAEIVETQTVPCIVLDLDDASARKLTVILNETRGKAQLAPLATLLEELSTMLSAEDLLKGLPYTGDELAEMLLLTDDYDLSTLEGVMDTDLDPELEFASIVCSVPVEVETQWLGVVDALRSQAPAEERKEGIRNGQVIMGEGRKLNGWILQQLIEAWEAK